MPVSIVLVAVWVVDATFRFPIRPTASSGGEHPAAKSDEARAQGFGYGSGLGLDFEFAVDI